MRKQYNESKTSEHTACTINNKLKPYPLNTMELKNLYERLKPEIKTKLELEAKLYPSMIETLFNNLKKLYFTTDITYSSAITFSCCLLLGTTDFQTIDNLFEENGID